MPRLTFRFGSKIERSKVKVTRPLNAVTENQPYLWNRKASNFKLYAPPYGRGIITFGR